MLIKEFKVEELIFGGIAISSIALETKSVVPVLVSCFLLSFYYIVFCWYLFSIKDENNIFRSILFGVLYSLIWMIIGSCTVNMFGDLSWFFYLIEAGLILLVGLYLFTNRNNKKGVFNLMNYWRIGIIIALNVFILVFK